MNFKQSVKDAWQIVTLNEHAIRKVAHEKDSLSAGIIITIIAGIAQALGMFVLPGIIFMPIGLLIGSFIGFGILHLLALLFGGKATFRQFFSVSMHTNLLSWISIIPFIGIFLNVITRIWGLVAVYNILKNLHQLSPGKALIVILLPVIIAVILMIITFAFMAAAFGGLFLGNMIGQ